MGCGGRGVGVVTSQAPAPGAAAGRGQQQAAPAATRSIDDPDVGTFVERELQAVLLQKDVSLVLQHVLGVLRAITIGGVGGRGSGRRGQAGSMPPAKRARPSAARLPPQEEFEASLSREVLTFLPRDSDTFAREVYLYLSRGLSVRAYDTLVFGEEVARDAAAVAAAEGSASGGGQRGDERNGSESVLGAAERNVVDLTASDDDERYGHYDGDDFEEEEE
ncbi:hypothetical protein GPECTOR_76g808 [Gonium pectorale]|uniref:Uncharacterized protein n=1 Tax=Gonium pectorale TaxID=33097 RepID=A0A150G298_GONPE|nr:hypothetical protein GPECTOR_76g808 [Gonium pectorale]|eukprot:KXZ43986.1 hypothetical protein GPECTOR_76g808 [Gonium pectorale]